MKREIIVTVVLIVLVVGLVLGMKFATGSFENSDAKKFVLEDLHNKFPAADKVEIVSFEPKTNGEGAQYYTIKASVSEGLGTPCPKRTNYYYNYPVQNFVPAPPEAVVDSCKVCQSRPCMIAFPEEAIIASHTLQGSASVQDYILTARDATPQVNRTSSGWSVLWNSTLNYSYMVSVTDDGYVSGAEKI